MAQGRTIAALVAGLVAGSIVGPAIGHAAKAQQVTVRMERCSEDAPFLRGRGDFVDGHYSRFECLHRDQVTIGWKD